MPNGAARLRETGMAGKTGMATFTLKTRSEALSDSGTVDFQTALAYIVIHMIVYASDILREVKKGKIPGKVFTQIHHCFQSMESVGDMSIFDVKQIKGGYKHIYYRLRKGQYRAIFHFEGTDIKVIALEHRSEVYRKWQS